jgi:AAA ATPase domain
MIALVAMERRRHGGTRTPTVDVPGWADFVGRKRELEDLRAALTAARSGVGGWVLVSGEAGIGKTALVTVLTEYAAEEGVRVVWGRCWDGGGAPPFWPWGRIVDELCRGRDREWLERELGGGAPWLGLMAPELQERLGGPVPATDSVSEQARFAMLNSLAAFLRAASAGQPILLALDDVDAAGTDTLLALEFASRELLDAPVLGVATLKEESIRLRPEAEGVLGRLARTCRRVDLAGLPDEDLALMLEQMTGAAQPPEFVREVSRLAAGNPFFAGEVVRTLAAEGELDIEAGSPEERRPLPSSVRDTVGRRMSSLPEPAREVLTVAAVVGWEFHLAIVKRATGIGQPELLAALDQARTAGLIVHRPGGATFGFAHGLVRETIYAGLATVDRARLHRAIGGAFEQVYEGELESHLGELAHHFFEAAVSGDPAKALAYCSRAGRQALGVLAWDDAARLFQEALAALELGDPDPNARSELLVELGRARAHAGADEARDTLRTAAGCAEAVGRPDLLARAALDFGAFALSPGIVDEELVSLLDRALSAVGPGESELRVRLLARLGVALYWSPQVERRLQVTDEAVAMARRLGDQATLAYALANRQGAMSSPDRTEECLETALELFRLTDSSAGLELELSARVRQIGYLLELDDLAGSDAALATLERLAAASHDPRAQAYVPLEQSRRVALEGAFDEAERLSGEAGRLGATLRDSTIPMQTAAQVMGMRWAQARLREMQPELKRFADGYPAMPVFRAAHALACYEGGRVADARRELRLLAPRRFAAVPRDNVWLLAMAFLSETCERLEDPERAEMLYELLSPFDGRNVVSPDAIFAGPVSRYLGLLAATRQEREAAEAHFTTAWEQAVADGARPWMARTRFDHARMLLSSDSGAERERAVSLLEEARALAVELGLTALLEWIDSAGPETGEAPREPVEPLAAGMHREGEVWRLDYGGRMFHVGDSKGMRQLAVLLAAPGVQIPAGEVEQRAGRAGNGARMDASAAADAGLAVQASPDSPLAGLDAKARREYHRRLEDLRDEIEQAEAWNDPERAARAREEMDFIASELAAAVGLGGRDRPLASGAERARVRVTRAIGRAIEHIGAQDEALAQELRTTIETGNFCAYSPDLRHPVAWDIGVR